MPASRFSIVDAVMFAPRAVVRRPLHFATLAGASVLMPLLILQGVALLLGHASVPALMNDMMAQAALARSAEEMAGVLAFQLFQFIHLIAWFTLMQAGTYRLMLREETPWWGVVQVGRDELRFLALHALYVIFWIGISLIVIALNMLAVGVIWALSAIPGLDVPVVIAEAVASLPALAAMLYLTGRLSPMYPLSLQDRRIRTNGWSVTKGLGGKIFAATGLVFLVGAVLIVWAASEVPTPDGFRGNEDGSVTMFMSDGMLGGPWAFWALVAGYMVWLFLLTGPSAYVAHRSRG